jgi:hypothetical protein
MTSAAIEPSTTDHTIRRRRERFVNRRTSWRSYLRRSLLAAASSRLAALALFGAGGIAGVAGVAEASPASAETAPATSGAFSRAATIVMGSVETASASDPRRPRRRTPDSRESDERASDGRFAGGRTSDDGASSAAGRGERGTRGAGPSNP